jgi:NADPH2:quinone reductase
MVVGFVAGIPKLPANLVLLLNRTVIGVDWGAWVTKNPAAHADMVVEVLKEMGEGRLHPVEPVSYPMSQAVQALRDMQNRKVAGKVILVPDFT